MGGEFLNIKEICIDDDKGRYVMIRWELFLILGGGIVIDILGMRELGMWDVLEGLDKSFVDIEVYFGKCYFCNCIYILELGCVIWEVIVY